MSSSHSVPHFKKMVIAGVGLIGGSLALVCREKGIVSEIVGVGRSEQNLRDALSLNVIDSYTLKLEEAVKGADIIVLATPVTTLIRLAKEISPYLAPGVIVTDVGSVKGPVVEIEEILPASAHFIGAHPIAGKEKSGVKAASKELFQGAKCILTPTSNTNQEASDTIEALWKAAGSSVIKMDPARHDLIFSAVSHLPHVVAYALVNTLLDLEKTEDKLISYSSGGFRDFTRIASSHPEMWRDICIMNKDNLINMLEKFEDSVGRLKFFIKSEDGDALYREFERARGVREKLQENEN
ncbi:MAG: prephenate dehydrogenase/arogenate dehydrogenase family protein [Nitrospira sp.]|nr:prephenate dehydrogenase/arogenate dehydrogenase family protein [Nitrospira sp.]